MRANARAHAGRAPTLTARYTPPVMVRLYAHRGAAAERPENTLAAFRRAVELGAQAIETDAHLTRDGQVVLSHDPTGKRMAGVSKAIRDSTLEEIWSWDAGKGFRDAKGERSWAGKGLRIPTLAEALLELPETPFNVDVKDDAPEMIPAILDVVRRAGAEHRVLLASFRSGTLAAIRAAGYPGEVGLGQAEIARLALVPGVAQRWVELPQNCRAQVPPSAWGVTLAKRKFVDRCHARGIPVDFWTINEPDQALRLVGLGADGIMTDDPARIAAALKAAYGQVAAADPATTSK